jgi:hypothetical protein
MDIFVGKEGFFYSRNNLVIADGQEHTITLHRQLIVSGLVTDSETKQPVASFEAIPGSDSEYWERLNLAHGTNGVYRLPLDEYRPPFLVRFEAEGYAPSISAQLDPSVTNVTCNIELKRQDSGDTIRGLVLLPDARQVAKAQVALLRRDKTVTLGRAKFLNLNDASVVDTDAEGRFSFPPNSAAYAVAAVDEHGFARVDLDKTNHTITIQLEPWGRIEGSLKLRSQTNAGQQICFFSPQRGFNQGHLALDLGAFSTKTDTDGNFVFEQVPVGDFELFLVPGLGIPFSHQTPVHIEAGTTLRVQIGGTGCSIRGRFVLSNPGRTVNWTKQVQFPTIGTKLPPLQMPEGLSSKEAQEFQTKFWQSEGGRAQLQAMRSFPLEVEADGSFRVDDVPPGRYDLNAQLLDSPFDPSAPMVHGTTIGSLRQEITVPESATGQSFEVLDLGNLLMTLL